MTAVETKILQIVSSLADKEIIASITRESRLKHDLGLDSLNMMELCVAMEGAFNITIGDSIAKAKTVQCLTELVNSGGDNRSVLPYNIEDYPLPKAKKHLRRLQQYMRLSRFAWRFDVSGLENIPTDGRYILCPNHQSYLDSFIIWSAIGHKRVNLQKICCLAAEMFLPRKDILAMLGGIPVERSGNTVPAMIRGLACIQEGYTMLIFPEGTRTRDGKMQEFKGGAAKLAIDADVPIIPVHIDGAWDIFPPHRKRPKVFRFGRRYLIKISFGEPMVSEGKSVEELTALVQGEVERLGQNK
jgi:long-chain acyl-CoA synthetase